MSNGRSFQTPQDFCSELYHETEVIDATTLNHVIKERDALEKENEDLKKTIDKHGQVPLDFIIFLCHYIAHLENQVVTLP